MYSRIRTVIRSVFQGITKKRMFFGQLVIYNLLRGNLKMNNDSASYSGGVGFFGLLTILFIGLKLGGVINWNWFWVLSPLLIPFLFLGIIFVILIIAAIIVRRNIK